MKRYTLLVSILLLLVCCHDKAPEPNGVFVAGTDESSSLRFSWAHDGMTSALIQPGVLGSVFVNCGIVVGEDIYHGGYTADPTAGIQNPVYWKNGMAVFLNGTLTHNVITAIAVSNNEVYCAGTASIVIGDDLATQATYWKGNVEVLLPNDLGAESEVGPQWSHAEGIFVSGNDVHVVGTTQDTFQAAAPRAAYWLNGALVPLEGADLHTRANSIFVVGSDVYIAGSAGSSLIPFYWKNGKKVSMTKSPKVFTTEMISIFAKGGHVYVGGQQQIGASFHPSYWVDGIPVLLDEGNNGAVLSIYADDEGDIYASGQIGVGKTLPIYWKNTVPTTLNSPTGFGVALAIAHRN